MTSEYNMIRAGGAKTPCVQGNGGSHPRVMEDDATRYLMDDVMRMAMEAE